jgi:Cys-rich protein (TIGR01571 family)
MAGYTSQPQMQMMPQDKHTSHTQVHSRSFNHGLCSCFEDIPHCCLGFWCPCIIYGHTRSRITNPALTRSQLPCCTGPCCGWAAVCLFAPGFQFILGCLQRTELRGRYGIEGNGCTDCLTHWCCDCCVLSFFMELIIGFDSRRSGSPRERGRCNGSPRTIYSISITVSLKGKYFVSISEGTSRKSNVVLVNECCLLYRISKMDDISSRDILTSNSITDPQTSVQNCPINPRQEMKDVVIPMTY